ncbi:MAG: propanediol utilization protein [Planctomycetes bacterium]|jgi:microcompartment protein CcmL/EutN|nr:propanediol utilization protein [Candidatus Woesearchaeota archaeon]MBJ76563.1 propanediol utilization protein [Planctomycetota bacterium]MDP6385898.1 BMC domain-containing protein [Planctomycetota bacterium]MDP6739954.1 BMC domain-containing protein [Planctomycetota bacterium]MDP6937882.1 BMC domain-containing protein [Planctomycetota bacterium]
MNRNDKNPHLCEEATLREAIAVLELGSVARGMEVADAILWEADIDLLVATHVQPGKYVLLFSGTVQDLTSALARGAELAACELVDQLLIPQVHPRALDALRREDVSINGNLDAVGVVETRTVASCIQAADQALKCATVDLLELRIANGLGGKSYVSMTGEVSDVRASVAAAAGGAQEAGQLVRQVVIPKPHAELVRFL